MASYRVNNQEEGGAGYQRFGGRFTPQSIWQRFFSRRQVEVNRVVYVGNQLLAVDEHVVAPVYPDNTVVSSKYTLPTFLPKNLFEQFRRIANFYFLCVALIQFAIDTPVTPLTSILPLVFVISVTAIKQGYEDWLRHKADNEVNNRPTRLIRNGVLQTNVRSMDIKVGDIVQVLSNEEFPCDLVMLSSEDPQGQCFITTANLDGETNLKTHFSLSETRKLNEPGGLGHLRARITCKPPIADLYTFEGVMEFAKDPEPKSLGPENILLRGARLKNTEYIYGCAIYTGKDTKMALNSKAKKPKFSSVEKKMNTFLVVFLVLLLAESVFSTVMKYWYEDDHDTPWYVTRKRTPSSSAKKALKIVEDMLAFMVLYNYIIPISLYVTVELQKFLGSIFFGFDSQMYDESINARAQANTSDLNEELGQVEYLFTDKTGTLTENTMMFRRCCVGTRQFEEVDGTFCERTESGINLAASIEFTKEIDEFLKVLVLCHTVRVDHHHLGPGRVNGASSVYSSTGEDYEYQASSPDEKALVEACCKYGIVYHGMNDDAFEVAFHGEMRRFKLLHTLPFDPTRKRMSVIVQDEKGNCLLLCKGAEVAILDRVVAGDVEFTKKMIDEYAVLGLRTLAIAMRFLSEEEYREIDAKLTEARRSLVRREEMLSEAYNEVEGNFALLGATAVEDKLQDQVPQTIEALRLAGIQVWVLTGDKRETAVNISHSAGHFNTDMEELYLTQVTSQEQCELQLKQLLQTTTLASSETQHALVIDGQSLAWALKRYPQQLRQLCSQCVAVLCCRMSPIQKAEIVQMIKTSPDKPVTAAIGDGANDVSMIQEAHVGLGIMGKEGRQAVRNSDYAFGKFRFLRRALLYHGHLYYNRIAVLVQYFFYKNIAWITGQLFYAIFSAWSQQSLFDPFFLVFYNLCFTSLPILIYGIFEQHKPQAELLNNPKLYRKISKNATLCWPEFLKWNGLGLWHCCVFFFGHYFFLWDGNPIFKNSGTIGNFDFGALILYTTVTAVNLKLMLETYYWCVPQLVAYIITLLGLIVLSAMYTNILWPSFIVSTNDMFKVLNNIYDTFTTWLAMLLLIVLALSPDVILRVCRDTFPDTGNSRPRKKLMRGVSAANGQAQVASTSPPQPHLGVDTPLSTVAETIELQDISFGSHQNSTLRGYENPALSMSSEDLCTAVDSTTFPSKREAGGPGPADGDQGSGILAVTCDLDQSSENENHNITRHKQESFDLKGDGVISGTGSETVRMNSSSPLHDSSDVSLQTDAISANTNVSPVDTQSTTMESGKDQERQHLSSVTPVERDSGDRAEMSSSIIPGKGVDQEHSTCISSNIAATGQLAVQASGKGQQSTSDVAKTGNALSIANTSSDSDEDLLASTPMSEPDPTDLDVNPQVTKEADVSPFSASPSHVVTIDVKYVPRTARTDTNGSSDSADNIAESAYL